MATNTHTDYLLGVRVEHKPGDPPHIDDIIEAINSAVLYTAAKYSPTVEIQAMRVDGPDGFAWYGATR